MAHKRVRILITHCKDCPVEAESLGGVFCNLDTDERSTPISGTPDWCPLEGFNLELELRKAGDDQT